MPAFTSRRAAASSVWMCDASTRLARRGGIVPCSVGSRSRSHGTMWTTTLTLRACMSASTVVRIALEDVGVEVERRLRRVPSARREAGAEIDHARRAESASRGTCRRCRASAFRPRACGATACSRAPTAAASRRGPVIAAKSFMRVGRVVRVEDEDVVEPGRRSVRRRQALASVLLLVALGLRHALGAAGLPRHEHAAVAASRRSTCTHGVGDEQPPAARAEQHRDRVARAVHVALPARLHRVERPRRSNCTGCSRHGVPCSGRGPPSPMPSTGARRA